MSDSSVTDAPRGPGYFDRAGPRRSPGEGAPPDKDAPRHRGRATRPARHGWRGRVVVPSLVSGVCIALSLPPWGFWVLALPAAGLLWWRLDGLRMRARFLAGFAAGIGLFVPGLWWATSFNTYGGVILMLVESVAPALACAVVSSRPRGRTAALAGAMVLAEYLRDTWPFGGLPMGGTALGQVGGPLAGAARLAGPLVLVALVWLAGGALAMAATATAAWVRSRSSARVASRRLAAALLTLAMVVGVAVAGAAAPDGGPPVGHVRVAAVQGGGARGVSQSETAPAAVYDAAVAATRTVTAHDDGRPPQLVLWPEDVVALDGPLQDMPAERQLAAIAVRQHATLLAGVTETAPGDRFRNEIVAFSPTGALVARFEKVHRVPFGEYVPYRGFFAHFANLSAVPLDAIPGHGDGVLHTPVGPLGTLVSYEVFYAGRGRVATRSGARLLVVPTNTSSYRTSQVPTQEVAAARLQAIAEGRDLVQAAPTGFSAVIDNHGRVLARSALAVRAVIVRDVALRRGATLYERVGDLPVMVLAVLALGGGVLWSRRAEDDPATTRRAPRHVRRP